MDCPLQKQCSPTIPWGPSVSAVRFSQHCDCLFLSPDEFSFTTFSIKVKEKCLGKDIPCNFFLPFTAAQFLSWVPLKILPGHFTQLWTFLRRKKKKKRLFNHKPSIVHAGLLGHFDKTEPSQHLFTVHHRAATNIQTMLDLPHLWPTLIPGLNFYVVHCLWLNTHK